MSKAHTESIVRLMEQFQRLPGIGPRSAERLAYHVLREPAQEAMALAKALQDVKQQVRNCTRCYNLSEQELCGICRDPQRDHSIVCVVEQSNDLISLEH